MLHHPFVDWLDLLSVDNVVYESYIDAFRSCQQLHHHPEDFYTDRDKESEDISSDTESEEGLEDDAPNANYPLADFEAFACRQFQDKSIDISQDLGDRHIDQVYN